MGAATVSELPAGFVLDQEHGGGELPSGFVADPPVGGAIGSAIKSVGDWLSSQPSWLEQARALHNASNPNTLRPTEAEIGFASGMVGPSFARAPGGLLGAARPGAAAAQAAADVPIPTTEELFNAAKGPQGYPAAATGPTFHPQLMDQLVPNIKDTMEAGGSRDYLAPKTFRAIQELKSENSVEGVQKVRSLLGGIADRGDKDERFAVKMAKDAIDEFLQRNTPEQAEILNRANANFAAASRSKKIDTAMDVAGLRTGRAGYGGNAVNVMRQALSPIVEKAIKGNMQGYSQEEIAAMRGIVEGTGATNALRLVGVVAPEKGGVSLGAGVGIGHMAAGPVGAVGLPVLGRAANKLADIMTEKQIGRLSEMVRKRSPAYEEAVKASANNYANTMSNLAATPSHQNLVKFVAASRSLAAGFNRDGIDISSGDLIKQFNSSAPAQSEQQ